MSWSQQFGPCTADELAFLEPENEFAKKAADQFETAVDAAWSIAVSGSIGDDKTHTFTGTLVGHSNPGHEPAAGWTNDWISVSVRQV